MNKVMSDSGKCEEGKMTVVIGGDRAGAPLDYVVREVFCRK